MIKANMLRFIFQMFFCFCAVFFASKAQAQNCNTVYDMIVELRDPSLGAYNLWDTVYGEIDEQEEFKTIVKSVASRNIVAIGEISKNIGVSKQLLITEVDRRGRTVWEKKHDVEGLKTIKGSIAYKKNYIILADIEDKKQKKAVWIGFLDEQGNIIQTRMIKRRDADLEATDMTLSVDKKSLLITSFMTPSSMSLEPSSALYWVDLNTKRVVRDRVFAFGAENKINAIVPMQYEDAYLASGYIRTENGLMAGWILKTNENGELMWQRQFSRGIGARFFDIAEFLDGQFIVAGGEAFAADDTRRRSAWVALIDATTQKLAWQRFYREDHALSVRSVLSHDDSQISVLIDAQDSNVEGDKDYVRLLNLNPRGIVLGNMAFHNGEGANAQGMIFGFNKERIMYGVSDINFDIEKQDQQNAGEFMNEIKKSPQAWIVAADAAANYSDPCRKDFSFIP